MDVRRPLALLLIVFGLLALPIYAGTAVRYTVTDLGTLGGNSSGATAINDRGMIVGWAKTDTGKGHAFVYDGTMHDLGTLGGDGSSALGINDSGLIVGAATTAGGSTHAFLWDGSMHDLGTLGGIHSFADGIGNGGRIVGSYDTGDASYRAFLYDGTMRDIGTLGGERSQARGTDEDGRVVGWADTSTGIARAFLYDGTMHDLGALAEGKSSEASAISSNGIVVGTSFAYVDEWGNPFSHAFLYDGTMHDLGSVGVSNSYASDINDNGHVVGWWSYPGVSGAFLYDGNEMLDLSDSVFASSGWYLWSADGINNSGQIVGTGSWDGGPSHALLLTPVPEPSSLACLGTAVLLLGGVRVRTGRRCLLGLMLVLALAMVAVTPSVADLCSEAGEKAQFGDAAPMPVSRVLPSGYQTLPTFPRYLWSFGCAPTSGAMVVGYYDNSGFDELWPDALAPTGGHPYDNGPFLEPGDPAYPSECDISASDEHVYDCVSLTLSGQYWWGHDDDRWYRQADGWHWDEHTPQNCVADYIGSSVWFYRENRDGAAWSILQDNFDTTAVHLWKPYTHPYPNQSGNTKLDFTYGLAQYIAYYGGYWCRTSTAGNGTDTYHDVYNYCTRVIRGYVPADPDNGVWPQDIIDEIDAGRPAIALLVKLNSSKVEQRSVMHAFPVFGYKQEQGQPLKLLVYDTWLEDNKPPYTTYRTISFPTAAQAEYKGSGATTETLKRESNGEYWKVIAFSFLQINNNSRCPDPLEENDYGSGNYADEFDIDFDLGHSYYYVQYDFAKDPNPESPTLTLDGNGQATYHIEHDCSMYFRTYRDADPPEGYLASRSIHRVYSVWTANKNIKKWEDGHSITTVNGIVTRVVDANHFYFEERDKRLFGILVEKAGHGLSAGDDVEVVIGTIETADNDERYIEATTVDEPQEPSGVTIGPFGIRGINVGGGDYQPAGGSGTNYGQAGVSNGQGVNNVGLLVRITGVVTDVDTNNDCFTLSDGSGADDSADNDGVKVSAPGLTLPDVDDIVTATGICTLEKVSGFRYPAVLVRDQDDLVVVQ